MINIMKQKKSNKKNSNVFAEEGFKVMICDGLQTICSRTFLNVTQAHDSALRIINHQKKLMGDSMTAYAMVFDHKKMLYYFD